MNCREAQKCLVDVFDCPQPQNMEDLWSHLAACHRCAREYAAIQAAAGFIQPRFRVTPSPDFKERVMQKVTQMEATRGRRQWAPRLALAATAAVVAIIVFAQPGRRSPALVLMAQSVQAMSNLQSVHITARMRTAPNENFEYINPSLDWAPLEIWKQFGDPPKWRVEKPGRVAVMHGTSSLMLVSPNVVADGGTHPGFLEWVGALLDTDKLMQNELTAARTQKASARMAEQDGHYVLTVQRRAQGDFTNDWMLNKSVSSSSNTRVYRFEKATRRLESMRVVLNTASGDVPVFEVSAITYNEALDPTLFTLDVPANAVRAVAAEQMPVTSSLPQTAKETAARFFDALARHRTDELLTVYPVSAPPSWMNRITTLQVISLGEPFQSGLYPGWFVPYEVIINGQTKKHNLAVRNDNPAHRWVFDGGL